MDKDVWIFSHANSAAEQRAKGGVRGRAVVSPNAAYYIILYYIYIIKLNGHACYIELHCSVASVFDFG